MPRQTRSQRRARREAQEASAAGAPVAQDEPPRARGAEQGPSASEPAAKSPASGQVERKYPGSGVVRFIGESSAELKKVEWPTQTQLVTGTTVVLIACLIVGFYLYANDQLWKVVVQKIFLR